MQTSKERNCSSEVPQRVSPQPVRKLKTFSLDCDSSSPSNQTKTPSPKARSPKVTDKRSPRSPVCEKRRPSKIAELESQVSQLKEELKETKDQLKLSESCQIEAKQELKDCKQQLSDMPSKLEESQKLLQELATSEVARVLELQNISQERDCATDEIHQLKLQHEMETLFLVEDMKSQLSDCKESESQAKALANETLIQLETAKRTVESLRSEGIKSVEVYNSITLELEKSRNQVECLQGFVSKLEKDLDEKNNVHGEEIKSTKNRKDSEMELLKSVSSLKEAELISELEKSKSDNEELKAELMDKELELQAITEENEDLSKKLQNIISASEVENELKSLKNYVIDLKSSLTEKETKMQCISEENEILKKQICKVNDDSAKEIDSAKSTESEALTKLGLAMEEVDKSNRKATRIWEQFEAAQVTNLEMEAELRRLKVQSDQWRKAAEAAAAMISTAGQNGKFIERTGSFSPAMAKMNSPYDEDADDDLVKKKNGNMLKKIGVLWKKPHK